ncbi:MAG: 3,4-dihydroxy-2-butanone-4-phosphate synthase [Pseudomonadota bacterium]
MKQVAYAEGRGFLSDTAEIIEDMRNGRMVILVDAEDRENEGDLVIPAQMATPDAINFMARHGRGLICLSLTQERADELQLEYMSRRNRARHGTNFTVSIEAREGISTGISAADRSRTILTAIDQTKTDADIVSPGHVFPLVARPGGVLVRAGHTEAAVDLARMAGLYPAGVICEIMNDDGTMARVPDLIGFAQRHGLKIGTIEDMIAYRLRHDSIVREVMQRQVTSAFGGDFTLHVFENTVEPGEHLALVKGDVQGPGPVLVRVHKVDVMADLLGVQRGDDDTVIARSMEAIAKEGRGVIVLIRDLRAKSVSEGLQATRAAAAAPALMSAPVSGDAPAQKVDDKRQVEIGIGSQILLSLGVRDMTLLTNSPHSVYVGLEGYGLSIVGQRTIA